MSYNSAPKGIYMASKYSAMYSFIQEVNEESPLKFEPNSEQHKQGDFK